MAKQYSEIPGREKGESLECAQFRAAVEGRRIDLNEQTDLSVYLLLSDFLKMLKSLHSRDWGVQRYTGNMRTAKTPTVKRICGVLLGRIKQSIASSNGSSIVDSSIEQFLRKYPDENSNFGLPDLNNFLKAGRELVKMTVYITKKMANAGEAKADVDAPNGAAAGEAPAASALPDPDNLFGDNCKADAKPSAPAGVDLELLSRPTFFKAPPLAIEAPPAAAPTLFNDQPPLAVEVEPVLEPTLYNS